MPANQEYLSPAAQAKVQPGQTPCQQSKALNKEGLSTDAVKSLAHGLPEKDSIKWASASAEKVSNPAHQADCQAIQAAKAYCQNPNPDTQKAAALAAANTDHQTPGAWAAQSAAWAGAGGGLSAHAVTGAVLLAAAAGGKPIPPPGAPGLGAPKLDVPTLAAQVAQPKAPRFQLPFFKKPVPPELPKPEVAIPGPDGLTLTPSQRAEMTKNCDPYLQLGCDIGHGKA